MVARLATALIAVALVAPPALAAASERGASAASSAPAGARLLSCRRSPLLAARVAVVGTWMRPLAAGRRLAVRVDLWQHLPGGRWTQRTDVPGLSTWVAPTDPLLGTRPGYFGLSAYPTAAIVEPTGAGDTFAGGLMGYVAARGGEADDATLRRAMAYGTAMASFNVEGFGSERLYDLDLGT